MKLRVKARNISERQEGPKTTGAVKKCSQSIVSARERRVPSKLQQYQLSLAAKRRSKGQPTSNGRKNVGVRKAKAAVVFRDKKAALRSSGRVKQLPLKLRVQPKRRSTTPSTARQRSLRQTHPSDGLEAARDDDELTCRKRRPSVKLEDSVCQSQPTLHAISRTAKKRRIDSVDKKGATASSAQIPARTPIVLRLRAPAKRVEVKAEPAEVHYPAVVKEEIGEEDQRSLGPQSFCTADQPRDTTDRPGNEQDATPAESFPVRTVLKLKWGSARIRGISKHTPALRSVPESASLRSPRRASRARSGGLPRRSQARRSLFRRCKAAVSLAKQLLSESDDDSSAALPAMTMRLRPRTESQLLNTERLIKSEVGQEQFARLPADGQLTGKGASHVAASKPQRLIVKLRMGPPPPPLKDEPAAVRADGSADPAPKTRETVTSTSQMDVGSSSVDAGRRGADECPIRAKEAAPLPLIGRASKTPLQRLNGGKRLRAWPPDEGRTEAPPVKARKMSHPAGSIFGALRNQSRIFPDLPPKLVSPVRLFSTPPVTRVAPDGAAAAARKAAALPAPYPKRKPQERLPRLLPRKLLSQARALSQRKRAERQLQAPQRAQLRRDLPESVNRILPLPRGAASGKPLIAGHTVNMAGITKLLEAADESSRHQLWTDIKAVLLQHSLQLVLHGLKSTPLPSQSQAKPTAGISYVLRSSSKQKGVEKEMMPLPHTVIRPPVPSAPPCAASRAMLEVLKAKPVAAAVMPLRDDAQVKQYLLESGGRQAAIWSTGGQLRTIAGTSSLGDLLTDRVFVCLHYVLTREGELKPCVQSSASEAGEQPSGPGIADSNLQIGLTVRRGVGGTCPARMAGRKLSQQGLLPALLDQQMPWREPAPAPVMPQPAMSTGLDPGGRFLSPPRPLTAPQHVSLSASPIEARQDPAQPSSGALQASTAPAWLTEIAPQAPPAPHCTVHHQQGSLETALPSAEPCGGVRAAGLHPMPAPGICANPPKQASVVQPGKQSWMSLLGGAASNQAAAGPACIKTPGAGLAAVASRIVSRGTDERQTPTFIPPARATAAFLASPTESGTVESASAVCWGAAAKPAHPCVSETTKGAAVPVQPQLFPPKSHAVKGAAHRLQAAGKRRVARSETDWVLAEEEGFDELLEEVDTMLRDPRDPDYDPSGGAEESSSSSDESEPEDEENRSENRHNAVKGAAVRMLTSGALTGHPRLRLYTRSCRLEMYVAQEAWETAGSELQATLMRVVKELEAHLGCRQLEWNKNRLLACMERMEGTLGKAALDSPLASLLLKGYHQDCALVKLELAFGANPGDPVRVTLKVSSPSTKAAATPQKECSSQHPNGSISEEIRGVCHRLLDSVCPQVEPDAAAADLRVLSLPQPAFNLLSSASSAPDRDVQEVVDRMLDQICPRRSVDETGSAAAGSAVNPSPESSSQEAEDAWRMREHNSFFALASAVATASSASRSVLGEFPWPFYFIGTRDCFTYNLVAKTEAVEVAGRRFTKRQYYFPTKQLPENYHGVVNCKPAAAAKAPCLEKSGCLLEGAGVSDFNDLMPAGVTTYTEVYSEEELSSIEGRADNVDGSARAGNLPTQCFHNTQSRNGHLKRTKFFFGARYLWTHEQLSAGASKIAGGVRVDVPPPYPWMKHEVEGPLVQAGLLGRGFVDSWALNLYHDGSEGIQSHYDDAGRFQRPITSLRLMSDSRLSFGTQLYGYTNGAFYIDMPRGCITVMEEGGYAATGLKHCVRPVDMTGKSAALIMRKIQPEAMAEALLLAVKEAGEWLAALTLREGATPPSLLAKMRADVAAREQQEANLKRDVWKVLDSCLRAIEIKNRPPPQSKRRTETSVSRQLASPLASQPPMLQSLAHLVTQVERLVRKEGQIAESEARDVETVMEQCLSSIERQFKTPLASNQEVLSEKPKAKPLPISSEASRLLALSKQAMAQLATLSRPLLAQPPLPPPGFRPPAAPISGASVERLGLSALPQQLLRPSLPGSMLISRAVGVPFAPKPIGPALLPGSILGVQNAPRPAVLPAGFLAQVLAAASGAAMPHWGPLPPLRPLPSSVPPPPLLPVAAARGSLQLAGPPLGLAALLSGHSRPAAVSPAECNGAKKPLSATSQPLPALPAASRFTPTSPRPAWRPAAGGLVHPSWLMAALQTIQPSPRPTAAASPCLGSGSASRDVAVAMKVVVTEAGERVHVEITAARREPCSVAPHRGTTAAVQSILTPSAAAQPPRPPTAAQSHKTLSPVIQSLIYRLRSYVSSGNSQQAQLTHHPLPSAGTRGEGLGTSPGQAAGEAGQRADPGTAKPAAASVAVGSGLSLEAHLIDAPTADTTARPGCRDGTSSAQSSKAAPDKTAGATSAPQGSEGDPLWESGGEGMQKPRGSGTAPSEADSAAAKPGATQSPARAMAVEKPACQQSADPAAAMLALQNELSLLVGQLQVRVNRRRSIPVKARPMKLSQYRALAKPPKPTHSGTHRVLQLPIVQKSSKAQDRIPSPTAARKLGTGACWSCFKALEMEPASGSREGGAWSCSGPCRRSFHEQCQPAGESHGPATCSECRTESHRCAVCKKVAEGEPLRKCSMNKCGLFFHGACAVGQPLTRPNAGGSSFRCPQHYCAACGLSGDSIAMVRCIRCCSGFHCRCRPQGCVQLTKKLIVCSKHPEG